MKAADYVAAIASMSIESLAVCTLVAVTALVTGVTAAAQERSKAETDAVALARKTLSATLTIPPDQISTISVSPA